MIKTPFSRPMDSAGRIIIPKELRDVFQIPTNKKFDLYFEIENDHVYLMIDVGDTSAKVARARKIAAGKEYFTAKKDEEVLDEY